MAKRTICVLICAIATMMLNAEVIKTPSSNVDKWYSRGVFYELFVRSYKDTNGDKYGDLNGVTEKLDHIKNLGISCIWLMPITDSAEHTNNYDPVDFMGIDPTYGTVDDFKTLLNEAHKRGLKIILDFVINHTSDQHPFFKDAATNKNSKYRDWYVFRDTQPTGAWQKYWNKCDTGWYYAYFVKSKPDLNFKNPAVIAYYKSVMKYWLDLGIDGLRFDAVSLLVENGDGKLKNQPENYEIYRDLRKYIETSYPGKDIFTVCESEPAYNSYLGSGTDMFNAVFNFKFNSTIIRTVKSGIPYTNQGVNMIETVVKSNANELANTQGGFYGTLLSNHDAYAGNRPFQQLGENIGKTKLAGAVYLTLPGIPFVYYGEEIAMDTYTSSKSDRWLRTCMIWDDTQNNGFTTAKNGWTMLNAFDDAMNKTYNVAAQDGNPNSILNEYRKIIKTRTENSALSIGDFESLDTANTAIVSYARKHGDNEVIVVHNFSDQVQNATITTTGSMLTAQGKSVKDLLGSDADLRSTGKTIKISKMAPYQTLILKVE